MFVYVCGVGCRVYGACCVWCVVCVVCVSVCVCVWLSVHCVLMCVGGVHMYVSLVSLENCVCRCVSFGKVVCVQVCWHVYACVWSVVFSVLCAVISVWYVLCVWCVLCGWSVV